MFSKRGPSSNRVQYDTLPCAGVPKERCVDDVIDSRKGSVKRKGCHTREFFFVHGCVVSWSDTRSNVENDRSMIVW